MTPAQFAACSRALDDERRQLDFQLGWIRCLLSEPYRDKNKHPRAFSPDEFSAYPSEEKRLTGRREMTPEQQRLYVVNFLHPLFSARAAAEKERARKGA